MSDPVNKFLKDCNQFSAFLDDLEKKTSKLDLEVNVLSRTADMGNQPSNAALQMLVEIRKMDQELKDEIRELTQTTEDNARFLDGMLEQVLSQKKEIEDWEERMAEYGLPVLPPIDPILYDIYRDESPAAAVDLVPGVIGDQPPSPPPPPPPPSSSGISDIPDLFDIGLSKETLRRYIGLKTTDNPDPKFGTSNTLNVPDDTKTTEYQGGESKKVPEIENSLCLGPPATADSNEISFFLPPILHSSAFNITQDTSGSPVFAPRGEKLRKETNVEVSPHKRKFNPPNLGQQQTPETPVLQSVNMKEYLKSKTQEKSVKRVSSPLLETKYLQKVDPEPLVTPELQAFKIGSVETPDTPVLETINIRDYLKNKEPELRASTTPEIQNHKIDLGIPISPETPVLQTINIREYLNKKAVEPIERQGDQNSSSQSLNSMNKPEFKSGLSATPDPKIFKRVHLDSSMPETPELATVNIREYLARRPM